MTPQKPTRILIRCTREAPSSARLGRGVGLFSGFGRTSRVDGREYLWRRGRARWFESVGFLRMVETRPWRTHGGSNTCVRVWTRRESTDASLSRDASHARRLTHSEREWPRGALEKTYHVCPNAASQKMPAYRSVENWCFDEQFHTFQSFGYAMSAARTRRQNTRRVKIRARNPFFGERAASLACFWWSDARDAGRACFRRSELITRHTRALCRDADIGVSEVDKKKKKKQKKRRKKKKKNKE